MRGFGYALFYLGGNDMKKFLTFVIIVVVIIAIANYVTKKLKTDDGLPVDSYEDYMDDYLEDDDKSEPTTATEADEELTTESTTEAATTTEKVTTEATTIKATTEKATEAKAGGIRSEFKEAMDKYEEFYDEYCEFMKEYEKNPSDWNLLLKYTEMMSTLVDMESSFSKWGEEELSNEELQYYVEVQARITNKLLEAAQ